MTEVEWTPDAIDMFDALMESLASISPQSAERISAEIVARIQQVVDFPFSGRVVAEYGERNFREIVVPPYRVMYRVRANGITIEVVARGSWHLR
ncbi:MAG: type II toxin-antitoxin system RelE/ParE family toxin [Tepidiformaceae bacterium]